VLFSDYCSFYFLFLYPSEGSRGTRRIGLYPESCRLNYGLLALYIHVPVSILLLLLLLLLLLYPPSSFNASPW